MKTVRTITIAAASFAMTAATLAPFAARAAEKALPAAVTLVRPGDRQLSCDALAGEINQLAAADPAVAKPKKKKGGLGFLKVLSMATPLAPLTMLGGGGGGGMLGSVVSQAAGAAAQGAAQDAAQGAVDAGMAALNPQKSIEAQRKDRLQTIFDEKRC